MTLSPDGRRSVIRSAVLVWAAFLVLTLLVVLASGPMRQADDWWGINPLLWHDQSPWLESVLIVIEVVMTTGPMLVYAVTAAAALALRKHPRAGVWAITIMVLSVIADGSIKQLVDRPRPTWDFPIHTLTSPSYPSGHATYAATAVGIVLTLSSVYVRRRRARRGIAAAVIAIAIVVGLDRLLLGVHTMSDVVAGYLLGTAMVLTSLLIYHPAPQPSVRLRTGQTPHGRYLAVILNPVKIEDLSGFRQAMERQAREAGWSSPAWYLTTPDDPGATMAHKAVAKGADLVVVCGGDGTVRTVCAAMAGTGVPVGVVPAGTGNLLARNLDLPLHLASAIDVALNGQNRAIDMVRVNGDGLEPDQTFLVLAGMGLDAAVVAGVDDAAKAAVGWFAYLVSGFRHLFYPPIRFEISVDGGDWVKGRARTVIVGNVGYLRGGMHLIPEATIDDGLIDVVVLYPRDFWSWLRVLVLALSRDRREIKAIRRMQGSTVSLRVGHDTPRQIDGDPVGSGRELHCECLHGQLLVRVPR